MILFFSGGSAIVEVNLDKPTVMMSYFNDVGKNTQRPNARLGRIIKIRTAYNRDGKVIKCLPKVKANVSGSDTSAPTSKSPKTGGKKRSKKSGKR